MSKNNFRRVLGALLGAASVYLPAFFIRSIDLRTQRRLRDGIWSRPVLRSRVDSSGIDLDLDLDFKKSHRYGGTMECGEDVDLCGVVAMSSGLGGGNYKHDTPSIHGLWPQVDKYGDSKCIKPTGSTADPTTVIDCYSAAGTEDSQIISFEAHEWEKHGECAGATDATQFFTSACALAAKPLEIMTTTRKAGGDLAAMAAAVVKAGYEIYSTDDANSQQCSR